MRRDRFNKKLLVEGNDDQHVIWALCEKYGLSENFDVIDCKGIDKLKVQLPVRFKTSGVDTIGIIIDADTDLEARWDSIKNIMSSMDFIMPDVFPSDGLIISNPSGDRRFGAWIMPNNNLNGMLEDFISFLIPSDDKLLPIVHSTIEDIESKKLNKYSLSHKSKAAIHTWLAWQEIPGTPMGVSITKRYLNTEEDICIKFIEWLKELFADS